MSEKDQVRSAEGALEDLAFMEGILTDLKLHFERRGLLVVVAAQTFDYTLVKASVSRVLGEGPPTTDDLKKELVETLTSFTKKFPHVDVMDGGSHDVKGRGSPS